MNVIKRLIANCTKGVEFAILGVVFMVGDIVYDNQKWS